MSQFLSIGLLMPLAMAASNIPDPSILTYNASTPIDVLVIEAGAENVGNRTGKSLTTQTCGLTEFGVTCSESPFFLK
jgi:hypothetical protein